MAGREEIEAALVQIREEAMKGQLDVAEALSRRLIEIAPEEPEAWSWLGLMVSARRRVRDAEMAFGRAVLLAPENSNYHFYLSGAVRELGRANEAELLARKAIELDARHGAYWVALGTALGDQRRVAEAAAAYREAVARNPTDVAAWQALAAVEQECGRLDEAQAAFERCLAIAPGGEAVVGYAFLLSGRGEAERAAQLLVEYLNRVPQSAVAATVLSHICQVAGDMETAEFACRRALDINTKQVRGELVTQPLLPTVHSSLLFKLPFFPGYDSGAIDRAARQWNEQHAAPLAKFIQPHVNDCTANRRLRVGYVSPNFRNHCLSLHLMPLFREHDRSRVELFCYSDVRAPDEITEKLRAHGDAWRETSGLTDGQVAELVRGDQIDILVDLTMHMEQSRLLVFARKPAPVQVCWMAYPGTTGVATMDYRMTDPHLDPLGLFDHSYSEKSIRLPDTFWCFDSLTSKPEGGPLPAQARDHVTFGNLNNIVKVNPWVLKLWASVLKAVDGSRMTLLAAKGSVRKRMLDLFAKEGIEPTRLSFVEVQPRPLYLGEYQKIDLVLDTVPYNGHTTSLDAFWMGVPVVTLVGQTVVGRAGLSMLRNLGLPELAAETPEQFVSITVDLAGNLDRLSELRGCLRERMQRSPLMDAPRFVRNIESAYEQMWRQWCSGQG